MDLAPSIIAVVVAIAVPWMTFRYALRQAQDGRVFDHRAQLYVDLLTEALAEKAHFELDIEDDETRARMLTHYHDLRLPALERARLGARGTIFASRQVNRLFGQLQGQALVTTLVAHPRTEAERLVARMRVGDAFDALEAQVRREMGADEIKAKK